MDILKSLNGASERNFFTSTWHSENNSRLLELISFLTLSIISAGRMSINLLEAPEPGEEDEVVLVSVIAALSESESPGMRTVLSGSSVFPFAKDVSLLSLCVSDRSDKCMFSFKLFN